MKYFLDTEFIESGPTEPIYLISIGIVAEDGREFYVQNLDCPLHKANDWVKENVIPNLFCKPYVGDDGQYHVSGESSKFILKGIEPNEIRELDNPTVEGVWFSLSDIKKLLIDFIGDDSSPEFWGYYADYDWVVFCQIFGTMIDLSKGFPMYCNDLKQLAITLGIEDSLDKRVPIENEHHALADAKWNKQVFEFLREYVKLHNYYLPFLD